MSTISTSVDPSLVGQYRKAITELEQEKKATALRNKEEHNKELSGLENRYKEALARKEDEAGKVIQRVKDENREYSDQEQQNYQKNIDQLKDRIYNQKGELESSIPVKQHNEELSKLHEESKAREKLTGYNSTKKEEEREHQLKQITQANAQKIEKLTHNQAKEVNQLSDQLADLTSYEKQLEHKKVEELAASRREAADNYKILSRNLEDTYNGSLARLKQDIDGKDAYYDRRGQAMLKEKQDHFTDLIRRENSETHQRMQDLEGSYLHQIDELQKEQRHQEKRAAEHLENKTNDINQQNRTSMENQARNFGETIDRIRKSDQDQIENLEQSLQTQKTTDDASLISPAAEASLRKTLTKEYEKKVNAQVERDQISRDDSREKFATDYKRLQEDFSHKETELHQANAIEKTNDRLYYFGSLQEVEDLTKAKLREETKSHNRETESMLKQFGNVMERQRKEYEHILKTVKNDSESKLTAFQKESEIASKTARRSFTLKENELIRTYEDKLANQKTEYDHIIDGIKAQNHMDLRDVERKAKQEIEAQAKGYEQRIAQIEAQSKEKEHTITQSYQTELDKVRRTYELLNQKKS